MYQIAEREYRATLDAHALLDFADLLHYTLRLLGQMEEFSQSRYRLESRYQHVLLDEFQDTSRPQWDLVALLIQSWGEGLGLAHHGPARAVGVHRRRPQAVDLRLPRRRRVGALAMPAAIWRGSGQGTDVRRSITRSFRSVTPLLAFVNDVCADIEKAPERADAFAYGSDDQFPAGRDAAPARPSDARLGLIAGRRRRIVRGGHGGRDRPAAGDPGASSATGRPACRGRSGPTTSPSCSGPARPTASSRTRSKRGACGPTSTRGWGSSTRTRSRTRWRALVVSGGAGVEPARGRLASLAVRAAVRRRPAASRARTWRGPWTRTTRGRPRLSETDRRRLSGRPRGVGALAGPGGSRAAGRALRHPVARVGLRVRAARAAAAIRPART